jgi:hypothetical protein
LKKILTAFAAAAEKERREKEIARDIFLDLLI